MTDLFLFFSKTIIEHVSLYIIRMPVFIILVKDVLFISLSGDEGIIGYYHC